jgi:hypothetical protein
MSQGTFQQRSFNYTLPTKRCMDLCIMNSCKNEISCLQKEKSENKYHIERYFLNSGIPNCVLFFVIAPELANVL